MAVIRNIAISALAQRDDPFQPLRRHAGALSAATAWLRLVPMRPSATRASNSSTCKSENVSLAGSSAADRAPRAALNAASAQNPVVVTPAVAAAATMSAHSPSVKVGATRRRRPGTGDGDPDPAPLVFHRVLSRIADVRECQTQVASDLAKVRLTLRVDA
jgi:hypothetical protein